MADDPNVAPGMGKYRRGKRPTQRGKGRGTGASAPPGKTVSFGGRTVNVRGAFASAKGRGTGASAPPGQAPKPPARGWPGETIKIAGSLASAKTFGKNVKARGLLMPKPPAARPGSLPSEITKRFAPGRGRGDAVRRAAKKRGT